MRLFFAILTLVLVAVVAYPAPAQSPVVPTANLGALVTLTAAGAGTFNSPDQTNFYSRGVRLGINLSAVSGTIAVTVAIQGKDVTSGQYYTLCQSTTLTGAGFLTLGTYPGGGDPGQFCTAALPTTWRVQVVSGTGSSPSVTMTIGASVIE